MSLYLDTRLTGHPRAFRGEFIWERGYAVEHFWPPHGPAYLSVFRIPVRGVRAEVVWEREIPEDKATVGGLQEAHNYLAKRIRDGHEPGLPEVTA